MCRSGRKSVAIRATSAAILQFKKAEASEAIEDFETADTLHSEAISLYEQLLSGAEEDISRRIKNQLNNLRAQQERIRQRKENIASKVNDEMGSEHTVQSEIFRVDSEEIQINSFFQNLTDENIRKDSRYTTLMRYHERSYKTGAASGLLERRNQSKYEKIFHQYCMENIPLKNEAAPLLRESSSAYTGSEAVNNEDIERRDALKKKPDNRTPRPGGSSHSSREVLTSGTQRISDVPTAIDVEISSFLRFRNSLQGPLCKSSGLNAARQAIIEALESPSDFDRRYLSRVPRSCKSILLYGPPGCGKCALVNHIAGRMHANVVALSVSGIMSATVASKAIFLSFDIVAAYAPQKAILLVHGIDTLFGKNKSPELSQARSTFTDCIKKRYQNVLVIATSTEPWDLDEGFKSLWERRFLIPLPDGRRRLGVLIDFLDEEDNAHELSFEQICEFSEETEGYSVRDLKYVVHDASLQGLRNVQEATHFKEMSTERGGSNEIHLVPCNSGDSGALQMRWDVGAMKSVSHISAIDFDAAMSVVKPSVSKSHITLHDEFTKYHGQNGS